MENIQKFHNYRHNEQPSLNVQNNKPDRIYQQQWMAKEASPCSNRQGADCNPTWWKWLTSNIKHLMKR